MATDSRWGSGFSRLHPKARPLFEALFSRMEELGHQPRSNYPHKTYAGAFRALDVVDKRWDNNPEHWKATRPPAGTENWKWPSPVTMRFYTDLGRIAREIGLTWGGTWKSFDGANWAPYVRWRKATGLGDFNHVEWEAAKAPEPSLIARVKARVTQAFKPPAPKPRLGPSWMD